MIKIIKSVVYLLKFENGLEVECKETNGLIDYIKPLNGTVSITFYLKF